MNNIVSIAIMNLFNIISLQSLREADLKAASLECV
jgi:hypothetical protein